MRSFVLLLFAVCISISLAAQDDLYFGSKNNKPQRTAGQHLVLSGNYQYLSIATGAASAISAIVVFSKMPNGTPEQMIQYIKNSPFTYIAVASTVFSTAFSFAAINHKIKAGRLLDNPVEIKAYANPNGLSFALKF